MKNSFPLVPIASPLLTDTNVTLAKKTFNHSLSFLYSANKNTYGVIVQEYFD